MGCSACQEKGVTAVVSGRVGASPQGRGPRHRFDCEGGREAVGKALSGPDPEPRSAVYKPRDPGQVTGRWSGFPPVEGRCSPTRQLWEGSLACTQEASPRGPAWPLFSRRQARPPVLGTCFLEPPGVFQGWQVRCHWPHWLPHILSAWGFTGCSPSPLSQSCGHVHVDVCAWVLTAVRVGLRG